LIHSGLLLFQPYSLSSFYFGHWILFCVFEVPKNDLISLDKEQKVISLWVNRFSFGIIGMNSS